MLVLTLLLYRICSTYWLIPLIGVLLLIRVLCVIIIYFIVIINLSCSVSSDGISIIDIIIAIIVIINDELDLTC